MRPKRPCVAILDEVSITRQGEAAVIVFKDKSIAGVNLRIGPELTGMSDQEVLDVHNDIVRAQQRMAASYKHVAIEIPEGSSQVEYSRQCDQWVPRGDVVRCVINDGGFGGEATVFIDERELSLREFGRLLTTHAGWGMRVTFVPDDRLAEAPQIEVREPSDRWP